MRSSRLGSYVLLFVGLMIILVGWVALEATQRQLLRLKTERAGGDKPATTDPRTLGAPRATGPLASGPTGASGATGPSGEGVHPPPSESGAQRTIPRGAIW